MKKQIKNNIAQQHKCSFIKLSMESLDATWQFWPLSLDASALLS